MCYLDPKFAEVPQEQQKLPCLLERALQREQPLGCMKGAGLHEVVNIFISMATTSITFIVAVITTIVVTLTQLSIATFAVPGAAAKSKIQKRQHEIGIPRSGYPRFKSDCADGQRKSISESKDFLSSAVAIPYCTGRYCTGCGAVLQDAVAVVFVGVVVVWW